jgi:hypothetical protein
LVVVRTPLSATTQETQRQETCRAASHRWMENCRHVRALFTNSVVVVVVVVVAVGVLASY